MFDNNKMCWTKVNILLLLYLLLLINISVVECGSGFDLTKHNQLLKEFTEAFHAGDEVRMNEIRDKLDEMQKERDATISNYGKINHQNEINRRKHDQEVRDQRNEMHAKNAQEYENYKSGKTSSGMVVMWILGIIFVGACCVGVARCSNNCQTTATVDNVLAGPIHGPVQSGFINPSTVPVTSNTHQEVRPSAPLLHINPNKPICNKDEPPAYNDVVWNS